MEVLDEGFRVGIAGREGDFYLLEAGDLRGPESALSGDQVEAAVVLLLDLDRLHQADLFDGPGELFQLLLGELLARIEAVHDVDQVDVDFGGCEFAHAHHS